MLALHGTKVADADLDEAWAECMLALRQAGIDISEVPLFVILGRPSSGEENLFRAAGIQLLVEQTPHRGAAPLHVYANREAVYVTCPGACLTTHLAAGSAEEPDRADRSTERTRARLGHVCRLIARARQPYCPVNGILVLVPFDAGGGRKAARLAARYCRIDLRSARRALQVECPLTFLVCDLEKAPGFRAWLDAVPAGRRSQTLGRRFPLFPDIEPAEFRHMVAGGLQSFGRDELPAAVYDAFCLEDPAAAQPKNPLLFRFLLAFQERCRYLSYIVAHSARLDADSLPIVTGCFWTGTGADSEHEQGFVRAVFRDLLENQNYVAWDAAVMARERSYQRLTRLGIAGMASLAVLAAACAVYSWAPW